MEQALALVKGITDPGLGINRLREYLQTFILRSLHASEAFRALAFVGGTALRFLHGLPRFSEDLDFSLVAPDPYDPTVWLSRLKRDLTLSGFQPELTWNEKRPMNVAWVRIPQLLHIAGFSPRREQKLSIKVEIDTRPPAGGRCERRIVTRGLTFFVQHHDLASLLAGKLHALICRPYAKGRDWYDLTWYLSQRPPIVPNLVLLQNALDQTPGPTKLRAKSWPSLVKKRLAALDFAEVSRDVIPFLEHQPEAALLTRENIATLLKAAG